jgi:hypothetical protein
MDPEDERRLALRVKRLEDVGRIVSVVAAIALAAIYLKWRWDSGVIAIKSWLIPFVGGYGVTRFVFTVLEGRATRALRAYQDSGGGTLPAARVVARPSRVARPEPARPPIAAVPLVAPEPPPAPRAPGEGPSILT